MEGSSSAPAGDRSVEEAAPDQVEEAAPDRVEGGGPRPAVRSAAQRLGRGAQAHLQGVQRRSPDRSGGRADVLRGPGDLPDADRDHLGARADRQLRNPAADPEFGVRGPRPGQADLHQRDPQHPVPAGDRGDPVRRRTRRRVVVGIWLRCGLHAGLQCRLGRARGQAYLQDASHPAARDAGHGSSC